MGKLFDLIEQHYYKIQVQVQVLRKSLLAEAQQIDELLPLIERLQILSEEERYEGVLDLAQDAHRGRLVLVLQNMLQDGCFVQVDVGGIGMAIFELLGHLRIEYCPFDHFEIGHIASISCLFLLGGLLFVDRLLLFLIIFLIYHSVLLPRRFLCLAVLLIDCLDAVHRIQLTQNLLADERACSLPYFQLLVVVGR